MLPFDGAHLVELEDTAISNPLHRGQSEASLTLPLLPWLPLPFAWVLTSLTVTTLICSLATTNLVAARVIAQRHPCALVSV